MTEWVRHGIECVQIYLRDHPNEEASFKIQLETDTVALAIFGQRQPIQEADV